MNKFKKEPGIYIIKNTINDFVYIGKSINVHKRILTHIGQAKRNIASNPFLEAFIKKWGFEALNFDIVFYCDKYALSELEEDIINYHRPKVFNRCAEEYFCVRSEKFKGKKVFNSKSQCADKLGVKTKDIIEALNYHNYHNVIKGYYFSVHKKYIS